MPPSMDGLLYREDAEGEGARAEGGKVIDVLRLAGGDYALASCYAMRRVCFGSVI